MDVEATTQPFLPILTFCFAEHFGHTGLCLTRSMHPPPRPGFTGGRLSIFQKLDNRNWKRSGRDAVRLPQWGERWKKFISRLFIEF